MKNVMLFFCLLKVLATSSFASESSSLRGCLEADIIFLLDYSGSVEGYEEFITSALKSFILSTEVSTDGVHVGYIVFSSNLRQIVPLVDDETELISFMSILENMQASGGTSLEPALIQAKEFFFTNTEKRGKLVQQIIVCVSDGQFGDMQESITNAKSLHKKDVKIFCIQTASEYPQSGMGILKQIATDENYYFYSDYVSLNETIKRLDICL